MVQPIIIERSEKRGRGRPKGSKNKNKRTEALDPIRYESSPGRKNVVSNEKELIVDRVNPVELVDDYQVVDSLIFTDSKKNTIEITLRQKKNRVYRMQIFLNHHRELRPITYNGSLTAITFWNLLKGTLNK